VPKVVLFRTEHSRRTLVPQVDFISAPGASEPNVHRTGGPIALITNRCLFSFKDGRFTLESVHPGHTVEEVIENTGFEFERPAQVPETAAPTAETLHLMRDVVAPQVAEFYPQFAAKVWGLGEAAVAR
jgi:glutaconate CoA-transferase subunit B